MSASSEEKTRVDRGIIFAQNRKFEYRGAWAHVMSVPVLNDDNHEVDQNLEDSDNEIPDENDCDDEKTDTDLYPLRFIALRETVIRNLKLKWPNIPIVPIKETSKHMFEFFDYHDWASGAVSTASYINSVDCQVIALVGILRIFKPLADRYKAQQFQKLRMTFVPSRKSTEEGLQTVQLMSDDGEHGVALILSKSCGIVDPDQIVSGIPCACVGFVIKGDGFVVCDIIYATPSPCTWPKADKPIKMVFVSGLLFGDGIQEISIEIEMLTDYLLGRCNNPEEEETQQKPKIRVFFVGNSFARLEDHFDEPSAEEIQQLLTSRYELDSFFTKLVASGNIEVILIPGDTDPTEKVLPQKPFDSTFFPLLHGQKFCKYFHDPCWVQVRGEKNNKLDVVLSSGCNIDIVKRYLPKESTGFIAQKMLEWGHLNPAARDFFMLNDNDSLKNDLFAIRDSLPHFYIIGNQERFMVREFKTTKIVSLPSFAETHQIATVVKNDHDSYDILPIRFGIY